MAMTPLTDQIRRRIAAEGPITLAEYMRICLLDPAHGYYATRDPFGAAGDFVTAPEISQMFGELIGLALAQSWLDQGSPSPFTLAEAGPGRGTLMADILRATRVVPGFHAAMRIVLIEASPKLRNAQAEKLADYTPAWTDKIDDLPRRPLWFVANEFFDALPIRQFHRHGDGWAEVMVALDDPGLRLALAAPLPLPELAHRLPDTRDGDIVELCPAARPVAATIGQRIATYGGAALLIDYGGWRSLGDTFQALTAHEPVDPLAAPGLADLTAHVDFEPIALAAAPAVASGLTPQGAFLERLGIAARAEALARRLSGTARDSHLAAYRRLTLPEEMGTLFQILALTPPGASPVPGMNDPRPSAP
ncbi:ATP synthase subunit beta [Primorskyibacter flagellatus]|uniref:ATP synthase subunit beta n=2 Tax=Primorskyibacter flagellatus TaxID=1387277 RepID=A0A917E9W6_9RHOB|nr:ATP synthase subunit beta [Primorskyibacter flagellatus]